ncbi:hypothetical protein Fmac_008173 [Flemingia macrophylla]|uniref:Uncharacterized protein n=1 Tax=Flemingia macrophylla TaxID=520843 RepID=A0ABD1MXV4_9FABA
MKLTGRCQKGDRSRARGGGCRYGYGGDAQSRSGYGTSEGGEVRGEATGPEEVTVAVALSVRGKVATTTSAIAQTILALTSFPVAPPHPLSLRDRHLRATATGTLRATATATSATVLTSGLSPLYLSSPFTPRDPEADRRCRRDSHHDWPFTSPLACPPSGVSPSVIIPLEKTLSLSTLSLEKTLNRVSNWGFRDNRISETTTSDTRKGKLNLASLLIILVYFCANVEFRIALVRQQMDINFLKRGGHFSYASLSTVFFMLVLVI